MDQFTDQLTDQQRDWLQMTQRALTHAIEDLEHDKFESAIVRVKHVHFSKIELASVVMEIKNLTASTATVGPDLLRLPACKAGAIKRLKQARRLAVRNLVTTAPAHH